jgi:hypothetical protein
LTNLKIKAQASDVAIKVQTGEIERLKKQVGTTETLLRQLLSSALGKVTVFLSLLLVFSQLVVLVCEY